MPARINIQLVEMSLPLLVSTMLERNLCTYFVLPLLGFCYKDFGADNATDTYMSQCGRRIWVKVKDVNLVPIELRAAAIHFYTDETAAFFCYLLPISWHYDIEHFLQGRYSRFSEEALDLIGRYSGLAYFSLENGDVYTDFRLQALYRTPKVLQMWKRHLYDEDEPCILDIEPDAELLEGPRPSLFFDEAKVIGSIYI